MPSKRELPYIEKAAFWLLLLGALGYFEFRLIDKFGLIGVLILCGLTLAAIFILSYPHGGDQQ